MNRRSGLFLLILIVILEILPANNHVAAEENTDEILINEYEEDVTGDGIKETIQLYGVLLSPESSFYRDIYATIQTKSNQMWKINYQGGYEPKLEFIDITQNGMDDILFVSGDDKNEESNHYDLHTIQQNKVQQQTLPSLSMTGEFIDNFQATLTIRPHTQPINIDLNNRADAYVQAGIFNEQGKILKKTSLIMNPISQIEPFFISQSKGYGLKTQQTVSGVNEEDKLGHVETLWYYEKDDWIILQSDWHPDKDINYEQSSPEIK